MSLDAALQALNAIYEDDGDAVAVTLEEGGVAPDVDLMDVDLVASGELLQEVARFVAEVASSFAVEGNRDHVCGSISALGRLKWSACRHRYDTPDGVGGGGGQCLAVNVAGDVAGVVTDLETVWLC